MNKVFKLLLIIAVSGFAGLILYGYLLKTNIRDHGKITIGKYVGHKKLGKHENNTFVYYISGNKFEADGGNIEHGFEKNLGKFYEIRYSEAHPNIIIANYENEITDRQAIKNAGFEFEDQTRQLPE